MDLPEVFMSQRREMATDQRGLPSSYARAVKALEGRCAHCEKRAVIANGSGVGLCATHRHQRAEGINLRERLRRQIEMARRG